MNYLVSYDIGENKVRKNISDYLIEKGFLRIQNSVFLGEISSSKIYDILENICSIVNEKEDSIFCVPINNEDYMNIFNYGKNKNYDLYKNEVLYL